jgi:hypothetical protein
LEPFLLHSRVRVDLVYVEVLKLYENALGFSLPDVKFSFLKERIWTLLSFLTFSRSTSIRFILLSSFTVGRFYTDKDKQNDPEVFNINSALLLTEQEFP